MQVQTVGDVTLLAPQAKDLGGGFVVRRLLPSAARQAVGPFLFFDHFGPVTAGPNDQHDVRPHPHIGLATVTYLFEGAMVHRDSTGAVQRIEPGAINWMTAGRGIVHSERTPDDLRSVHRTTHGLQLWAALPEADEEIAPSFSHTPAAALPRHEADGVRVRLLIGDGWGLRSPVPARSPTLYADLQLAPGARLPLDVVAEELAVYAVDAAVEVGGVTVPPQRLAVLGATRELHAPEGARVALVGGQPLGHRHLWWNFVSSRRERIVQAADAWAAERFGGVPGEHERIPLPDRRPS